MIFAAVFFCSVIGYGALNLWYAKEPLAENVQEAWDNIREEPAAETVVNAVADLDTAVTENTLFRYPLLECYGGMQLALGKHEENALRMATCTAGTSGPALEMIPKNWR